MIRAPYTMGALLFTLACGSSVNWRNHIAFRSTGTKLEPSTFDKDEAANTAISTNLHYVSISLDSVFFRNLPGIGDSDVAFGFEINGVLGEGKTIRTILDAQKGVGENAFLNFDNLVVIDPFLYKGENMTINFRFTAVPGAQSQFIKAQLQGPLGDTLKKINPSKYTPVEHGASMFSNVFGGYQPKQWNYGTTFFPADRVYRDKPDLLFTAGRHILISVPPADAPSKYKKLQPLALFETLKMRGNRLVKPDDTEFTDLPYIVLNITRYKRYPKTDTKLREALKAIDAHIENGSLELAQSMMQGAGAIINEDPVITATEKNLERSWLKWREERIGALKAKKEGKKESELYSIRKEVDQLFFMVKEFEKILEPFEIKDFLYRLNERLHRSDELVRELREPSEIFDSLKARYARLVKELTEPKPRVVIATGPPVVAVAPPTPPSTTDVVPSESIFKRWWFWTAIGAVVTGTTLFFTLRSTDDPCKGGIVVGDC